jgi:hypothetical protein
MADIDEHLKKLNDSLADLEKKVDSMETTTKNPIKGDAEEDKEKKPDGEGGEPPPKEAPKEMAACDKKKDDADEEKAKADKAKADAEEEEKKKEEEEKKADAARADAAATVTALKQRIADLERVIKPRSDEEHAAFADAQSRADAVFNGFGKRAPRPLEGEALVDYRKRLATHLKVYSDSWKNVKLSQLPDQAFDVAEGQIYADSVKAAASPIDLSEGELRAVTRQDQTTGQRTTVFYGNESFVKGMGRPSRRVRGFRMTNSV